LCQNYYRFNPEFVLRIAIDTVMSVLCGGGQGLAILSLASPNVRIKAHRLGLGAPKSPSKSPTVIYASRRV